MFTGIVEELGEVRSVEKRADVVRLTVSGTTAVEGVVDGDSLAVNGVCLTVVDVQPSGRVGFDVMPETLQRSSLGAVRAGAHVNLERAMRADGRLGGHIVAGHVDGTAPVLERRPGQNWEVVRLGLPRDLERYVVHKGSVTVDGVSLTVSGLGDGWFEVSLIPTTLELTTLGRKQPGEIVNLEVDVIAKYVERLLAAGAVADPGGRA
jgi:riboflavin synthase